MSDETTMPVDETTTTTPVEETEVVAPEATPETEEVVSE